MLNDDFFFIGNKTVLCIRAVGYFAKTPRWPEPCPDQSQHQPLTPSLATSTNRAVRWVRPHSSALRRWREWVCFYLFWDIFGVVTGRSGQEWTLKLVWPQYSTLPLGHLEVITDDPSVALLLSLRDIVHTDRGTVSDAFIEVLLTRPLVTNLCLITRRGRG